MLDPCDSTDFLFPAPTNPHRHISYSTFRTWWDDCVLEIGLPGMTPHMFRHGLASIIAAENPGNWALLAALLGDAESTCRDYYAWIDKDRLIREGHAIITKGVPHALAA